ncbi:MAG: hypothetical protein AB1646_13915 [Thermodesulfobacteriota bacterium]
MPPERKVSVKEIVEDIRLRRLSDPQLMEKYKVSAKGLQSVFQKLLQRNAVNFEDIEGRSQPYVDTITLEQRQEHQRHYLPNPVPIYESKDVVSIYERKDLQNKGRVNDITEKGVGVVGLDVREGETKSFVIVADEFVELDPFSFDATCRWVQLEASGEYSAGFEITKISERALNELRKLIERLTSCPPPA